jgi:hypothetical protein
VKIFIEKPQGFSLSITALSGIATWPVMRWGGNPKGAAPLLATRTVFERPIGRIYPI